MKAIKLASVFAVSAVAAAVSTTTLAAEPVFSGSAGLYYTSNEEAGEKDSASSDGEVNIIMDTGVVYFDLDMENGSDGGFDLDEAYITQGAVQFGDFDGSLIDSAAYSAGVWEDIDDAKYTLGNDLGVRYAVNDALSVSAEIVEGENDGSLAFAYETEMAGLTLGVSGGFNLSSDDKKEGKILTLGVSAPLGMATMSTFVQVGSDADRDVLNTGVGIDLPLSEQLSVALQYYTEGGEQYQTDANDDVVTDANGNNLVEDKSDAGITEATVYYAVGDVTYYATYVAKEAKDSDYTVIGATVSF
ncbi:hypothetical protein J9B83_05200 [Marinomonas sp. A79]|uniref:Porin domain-containing protein n=1 Tax=Marinomonas vulgaris TaxID=2823372 RepID=A0ABS5H9P0_9GAMM|nr:hypothetical protein [Marinomonas vulgaris]MBR7888335.1 hypothetical protein [Marinomonas vulgaris]